MDVTETNHIIQYISCCLTGRLYPHGACASPEDAERVKCSAYDCLFSGPDPLFRSLLHASAPGFCHALALGFDDSPPGAPLAEVRLLLLMDAILDLCT